MAVELPAGADGFGVQSVRGFMTSTDGLKHTDPTSISFVNILRGLLPAVPGIVLIDYVGRRLSTLFSFGVLARLAASCFEEIFLIPKIALRQKEHREGCSGPLRN